MSIDDIKAMRKVIQLRRNVTTRECLRCSVTFRPGAPTRFMCNECNKAIEKSYINQGFTEENYGFVANVKRS